MEIRHAETDFFIRLESTRGRSHDDRGGFEGVVGGELEDAVVNASLVGCVMEHFGVEEEVRMEEVGFEGMDVCAWCWVFLEVGVLLF